jgi:hypothetical protein
LEGRALRAYRSLDRTTASLAASSTPEIYPPRKTECKKKLGVRVNFFCGFATHAHAQGDGLHLMSVDEAPS